MKIKLKKETQGLSNYDLNVLLPILIKGLKTKKGKANAVNGKQIIERLRNHGLMINTRSMGMLIRYIRTNDLIEGLMASSAGYYISNNEYELANYEASLLGREESIRDMRISMQRQRRKMFAPRQRELF
ncbi:MAG: hypothetical protein GX921_10620 [Bacteroidales bacterium]|nr:hypothetical protein [Bacteroidales bacterium]